jgi:ribosomal protein S18 acetylase RimI-like enzyme
MDLSLRELSPSEYPWNLFLLADPSRDAVEKYIHESVVVALTNDECVAGVVVLTRVGEGAVEIKNIAVDPAFQGQGIGKKLLEEAIRRCRAEGAREVVIGTGNSSVGQLALYQKVGFQIVGIDRDFFTKNYPEPIIENGIVCRDMIRLSYPLSNR